MKVETEKICKIRKIIFDNTRPQQSEQDKNSE